MSVVLLVLACASGVVGSLACSHDYGFALGVALYALGAFTVAGFLWLEER